VNKSKWPLVGGVVVVGALAGLALGGRPTTLPEVNIPVTTSTVPTGDTGVAPITSDTAGG
jgi:hypothetical protein